MTSIIATLLSYVLIYKYYALFLISFVAAIGVPLPLDMTIVAVGTFAGEGYLNSYIAATIIIVGNILGDIFDYWLAWKYGHTIVRDKYARRYPFFVHLEKYLQNHSRITIFVTRFVGVLSPLTNFLSGYTKIPPKKFIIYVLLGDFVDDLLLFVVGFIVGDYWQNLSGSISLVGWIIGLGFVAYVIFQIFYNKGNRGYEE